MMQGMLIDMEEAWLQALAQVKIFFGGTAEIAFRVPKAERHRLIEPVRKRFGTARTQPRLHPPSYRHGRGRAGRNGCPFGILDSIRITARSPSITKFPGYWKRYGSSSPHHAPDTPTIPLGGVQERRSRAQTSGLCPNPPHGAGLVNDFCSNHFNPYVNFHRQCFFLETITVPRGGSADAIATRI
jgi:hypothetical protein